MKTLKEIKDIFAQLDNDTNEETIKRRVVEPLLTYLGYNDDWFYYEEHPTNANNKRVDISIHIENNLKQVFFIEVKRKNNIITPNDITQLTNYLNDKNLEWGLLTNGNKYILLNNEIKAPSSKKVVLEYSLFYNKIDNKISISKNDNNLKFLTKESLFDTKITEYLCLISEFLLGFEQNTKKYNVSGSKAQYESAIYMFIEYLIRKEHFFNLQYINSSNFTKFLNELSNNKKYSNYNSAKMLE